MAVFSMGTRTGYYRWRGENCYWIITNTPTAQFSTTVSQCLKKTQCVRTSLMLLFDPLKSKHITTCSGALKIT